MLTPLRRLQPHTIQCRKIASEENIDNSSLILVCYIVIKYFVRK